MTMFNRIHYDGGSSPWIALYLAISSGKTFPSSEMRRLLNFCENKQTNKHTKICQNLKDQLDSVTGNHKAYQA